jgi:uncharacterized protein YbaA (DUF1428 family)
MPPSQARWPKACARRCGAERNPPRRCFITPVPRDKKDAYREMAAKCWPLFKEFGATRQCECWADDVPDGKTTDFKRAVKLEANETVVFSWVEYPSKAVRDAANERMKTDPRMKQFEGNMPFDGKRAVLGGFLPILDESTE